MLFKLVFTDATEKLTATTELEAENRLDALMQATGVIARRELDGLRGVHVLQGPGGEDLHVDKHRAAILVARESLSRGHLRDDPGGV